MTKVDIAISKGLNKIFEILHRVAAREGFLKWCW